MKISLGFGTSNIATKLNSVGLRLREFSPQRAGRLSLTACKRSPLFVKFPPPIVRGFFICAGTCAGRVGV